METRPRYTVNVPFPRFVTFTAAAFPAVPRPVPLCRPAVRIASRPAARRPFPPSVPRRYSSGGGGAFPRNVLSFRRIYIFFAKPIDAHFSLVISLFTAGTLPAERVPTIKAAAIKRGGKHYALSGYRVQQ